MIRQSILLALLALSFAMPTVAQDHDHNHEASEGDLTIVHPWARAASAGGETMVFFEIENAGAAVELTGAEADIATSIELVGAALGADANQTVQPVGAVSIATGDFVLEPSGLGFLLTGLTQELVQGEEFELEVEFSDGTHIHAHVEIEAADATQHSHAGHSH
ncbi:MAG: copper chaperone PCu(A)C [Candidatus Devosia phytovorans]|uniref:Copper chaperone PCu(A)C n=1 Tax=Candidatus Devosia phytovorans TaxID=3121372 RepID=A0AAJ5VW69_9HYPH|nr:copper chaperone PCu(A)C [Devosia sp.]WEK05909.1 MAG: copper chaperone PCu(A)C [Devosia sp.]